MSISRRYLPPLSWLTAFEAVARLGSVTEAAAELDLTQGAVSRQIQKLEEMLDVRLFHRQKRRLVVTPAGKTYGQEIQAAITGISNATLALKSNPDGGLLELAILPAFGTHWLAPRLPEFLGAHPGVTLNLATRTVPFSFGQEKFHAAIHFGAGDWPETNALKLMDEELLPVVSRDLCPAGDLNPSDLAEMSLLHLETRADVWGRWFEAQGILPPKSAGIAFDQFATMHRAVIYGAGAALMPRYLVERDLSEGRLVTIAGAQMRDVGAYYLVWPETLDQHPPVVAFREWVRDNLVPEAARSA